jgi:trehalose/maltose hydrolase-like predicted phosphorylase
MGIRDTGWELFMDALRSDLVDIQGGTTGEGVHCGVMAGTVYDVLVSYAGLDLSGEVPSLAPELPGHWKGLEFRFTFRGNAFLVSIAGQQVKITRENRGKNQIKFHICGKEFELSGGKSLSLSL